MKKILCIFAVILFLISCKKISAQAEELQEIREIVSLQETIPLRLPDSTFIIEDEKKFYETEQETILGPSKVVFFALGNIVIQVNPYGFFFDIVYEDNEATSREYFIYFKGELIRYEETYEQTHTMYQSDNGREAGTIILLSEPIIYDKYDEGGIPQEVEEAGKNVISFVLKGLKE